MYTFPFGQPIVPVRQKDDGCRKKIFVLGVYASAVHVKWYGPDGKIRIRAMAVASEPEIFWKGNRSYVESVISRISLDSCYGYLEPADGAFNGPSGICLDTDYLEPLGLTREDVWLCDLLPESRKNPSQEAALAKYYDGFVDIPYSFPPVPRPIADHSRIAEIIEELEKSGAMKIILLGDEPIRYFLKLFRPELQSLSRIEPYGKKIPVKINGREYSVVCLAHPRQTARLGNSSPRWYERHQEWKNELKQV